VEEISRIFVDTSKQLFQLHGVDAVERVVVRRKLRREQFLAFFAGRAPLVVGLEACAASHHWARELMALGHEVRLIAPQHVKSYVKRNKNDLRDAEGGCEAMSRPTMRFVPVKTVEQQAGLMLLTRRERLVAERTALGNAIRGHAAEFGWTVAKGLDKIALLLTQLAAAADVPDLAKRLFARDGTRFSQLQEEIAELDREVAAWRRNDEVGDEPLRAVLVAGAMAVIQQAVRGKGPAWPWLAELLKRKPRKLAAVALANKLARIAWRLMVSGQAFDPQRIALAA